MRPDPWTDLNALALACIVLAGSAAHSMLDGGAPLLAWPLASTTALAGAVLLRRLARRGTLQTSPRLQAGVTLGVGAVLGSVALLAPGVGASAAGISLNVTASLLAIGGAWALAASTPLAFAWVVLLLGPLAGRRLHEGSAVDLASAAMIVVLGLGLMLGSATQRRLLRSGSAAQRDNDALIAKLRQQVELVEQANREKSRFLAAASHDLRQPMHALGLFAATLEKSLSRTPLHATVANMMRAVDGLEQSFSAMLDISKLDAGVVEPTLQTFPIRDVFRRLNMHCAGHAAERGLSLRFKPGGKLVTSDPQLLERILSNLVHNAIRYTPEGAVVVVVRSRRGRLAIEVWDTGIGIEQDELPRVFDEFYQIDNHARDRTQGLGMGLAIVKRLVRLLGHELEVRSTPGRGSVFRVLLVPTQLADLESMVLGADTVPSPIETHRTVLLIDDEESIRTGMVDLLRTWGWQVLAAESAAAACVAVRRHAGVIDLVVSDLRLADHEDGIAAIERVREVYGAPLPAVLVTGDTSPEEVRRAHDSGHPVLFKPVRPRDLHAALRNVP